MKQVLTRGHLRRLAAEHGWRHYTALRGVEGFERGGISVRLHYSASGQLIHAARYTPTGVDRPHKGRQTYVRQWLTQR